mmetsp:Transcript_60773/g.142179  ORF Transcript_60773/g.142179 Transcript_60773/m.142179 type:complete len:246 (+) Transcript_60773:473-1210(+)
MAAHSPGVKTPANSPKAANLLVLAARRPLGAPMALRQRQLSSFVSLVTCLGAGSSTFGAGDSGALAVALAAPPAATSASKATGEPGRSPGVTGPAFAAAVGAGAAGGDPPLEFLFLDFALDLLWLMAPAQADTPGTNSWASGFRAFASAAGPAVQFGCRWFVGGGPKVMAAAGTITGGGWNTGVTTAAAVGTNSAASLRKDFLASSARAGGGAAAAGAGHSLPGTNSAAALLNSFLAADLLSSAS